MTAAAQPVGPRPGRAPSRRRRPVAVVAGRRRRPGVPALVGVGLVVAALFAVAAMHAVLITRQHDLDQRRREVAGQREDIRRLQQEIAELEAPQRVHTVALEQLGMVEPAEIGFLLDEGTATEPVRVSAASAGAGRVADADEATR